MRARQRFGEAWERQSKESLAAWSAFRVFRDLGDKRSIEAAMADPGVTAKRRTLSGWASLWHWNERAAAYDAHLDRGRVKAAAAAAEAMAERQIEQAMSLQRVGGLFFEQVVKEADETQGGDPAAILKRMTPHTALRAIETGVEIERKARKVEQDDAESARAVSIPAGVFTSFVDKITTMAVNMAAAKAMNAGTVIIAPAHQEDEEATA